MLGAMAVVCGLAGLLISFPYFAIETTRIDSMNVTAPPQTMPEYLCSLENSTVGKTDDQCRTADGTEFNNLSWVVPFICICVAIQGIAKSSRMSLSSLYIDTNVRTKFRTGFHIGKVMIMS